MAIVSYYIRKLIELKVTFRNDAGAVTDPTSPTLAIHKPDGTITTYVHPTDTALMKDSTGVYHVNYIPTMRGTHKWEAYGTGAVYTGEMAAFNVLTID